MTTPIASAGTPRTGHDNLFTTARAPAVTTAAALLEVADTVDAEPSNPFERMTAHIHEAAAVTIAGRSGAPTFVATSRQPGLRGDVYHLQFDRPVSREDAERALFQDGRVPRGDGRALTAPGADGGRVLLVPRNAQNGKATQWDVYVPNHPLVDWGKMNPGVEDTLLGAPAMKYPAWVPAQTARMIDAGKVPPTAEAGAIKNVRTGFAAPNDGVTVWTEGDAMFRYDAKTGTLEGFKIPDDPKLKGMSAGIIGKVFADGRSLADAYQATAREMRSNTIDAVLIFSIGSLG